MFTAAASPLSAQVDPVILAGIDPATKRKCSSCGRPGHDRRSCGRLGKSPRPFDPWSDLEWEEHDEARKIVADHPDGMTLEEVGTHLGITRERVRQIEAGALKKLRDGVDTYETVDVGMMTRAILDCERCGSPFIRRGRLKVCELCSAPRVEKPKLRLVKRAPAVEKAPPFRLALNLRWS